MQTETNSLGAVPISLVLLAAALAQVVVLDVVYDFFGFAEVAGKDAAVSIAAAAFFFSFCALAIAVFDRLKNLSWYRGLNPGAGQHAVRWLLLILALVTAALVAMLPLAMVEASRELFGWSSA
ncbi:MAG: hypothetical protein AAFR65_07950 [Pseudomonadota bacterium]